MLDIRFLIEHKTNTRSALGLEFQVRLTSPQRSSNETTRARKPLAQGPFGRFRPSIQSVARRISPCSAAFRTDSPRPAPGSAFRGRTFLAVWSLGGHDSAGSRFAFT